MSATMLPTFKPGFDILSKPFPSFRVPTDARPHRP